MKLADIHPPEAELRLLLEAGFLLRTAGRIEESTIVFQGVRELLPTADVPLVALSTLELHQGHFARAQNYCDEALRLNPDSLYARLHRAEALLMQQQEDEARSELEGIIAADPTSPHSHTAQALLAAAQLFKSV